MAVFILVINVMMLVPVVMLYRYLYSGKEKPVREKNYVHREIFLGIMDALKEQHESGRK